ncbi:MAG: hypothetical protein WC455_14725 [Dehalococcoidia bacterium]|jgi:hypothetical protein
MEKQALLLKKHLEANGFEVILETSALSESAYITASHEKAATTYRVRLSNHTARPTYDRMYGEPDYEVGGDRNANANSSTWRGALAWLCKKVNIIIPAKPARAANKKKCPIHGSELYWHDLRQGGDGWGWYCPHGHYCGQKR